MESVLVTGANGFVAGHLCRHLVNEGYRVRGSLRRGPEGQRDGIDYRISGNIDGETDWRDLLEGVDYVIHIATAHQPRGETPDPFSLCWPTNVLGTERLARQSAAQGVKRFVFTSSISAQEAEQAEAAGDRPGSLAYGFSKLEAERLLAKFSEETGLDVVVLRPPGVYGPDDNPFGPLLQFLLRGWPVPFGNVHSRRSYLYVGNLVSAIAASLRASAAVGRVLPVADGEPVSTVDMVRQVAAAIGRPARLFPCPRALLL